MAIDDDTNSNEQALHTAICDFLDALDALTRAEGFSWREKKSLLLAACTPEAKAELMDLVSWFEPDEEDKP
jgi:hypothetical protein